MGRPARPLHDAGNNRSAERGSNLQVAHRGNLTISAKPARERENLAALTPLPGTRSRACRWFRQHRPVGPADAVSYLSGQRGWHVGVSPAWMGGQGTEP